MRYESVATMRSAAVDPGHEHAGQQRPAVVVGRGAHHLAHRFTQVPDSESCVVGSLVLPTGGNSTTGYVCSLKVDRAAVMVMWSPSSANVTAPGSSRRTMSVESRAGMTQLPSSIPMTSPVT